MRAYFISKNSAVELRFKNEKYEFITFLTIANKIDTGVIEDTGREYPIFRKDGKFVDSVTVKLSEQEFFTLLQLLKFLSDFEFKKFEELFDKLVEKNKSKTKNSVYFYRPNSKFRIYYTNNSGYYVLTMEIQKDDKKYVFPIPDSRAFEFYVKIISAYQVAYDKQYTRRFFDDKNKRRFQNKQSDDRFVDENDIVEKEEMKDEPPPF